MENDLDNTLNLVNFCLLCACENSLWRCLISELKHMVSSRVFMGLERIKSM